MNTYKPVKCLTDVIRSYADEDKCRQFLVQQRWNGCPQCPYCNSDKYYVIENGRRFKCGNKECHKKYSVTVGTIFHASNIPLSTWFAAIYLISAHKKGISSCQLARDIGVSQKSCWFMLHRIRQSLQRTGSILLGSVVEVDCVYVGGKISNMSNKKRAQLNKDKSKRPDTKVEVVGMLQRGGDLRLIVSENKGYPMDVVEKHIEKEATVYTDSDTLFNIVSETFAEHQTVNHTIKEFVRGDIHTNGIEGAFSWIRRSVIGIYHRISPKHLSRYCDEISYKYNTRALNDGERFEYSLTKIATRLSYKELIKKTELTAEAIINPSVPELGISHKNYGKSVYQLKNGNIIAKYPSITEAARITNLHAAAISKVVTGERRKTGGFEWKYA